MTASSITSVIAQASTTLNEPLQYFVRSAGSNDQDAENLVPHCNGIRIENRQVHSATTTIPTSRTTPKGWRNPRGQNIRRKKKSALALIIPKHKVERISKE